MTDNSPYLGLRPFQEKEQAKFFGRLPEIHILTDKILAHRFTLLVAASGVGKSSLLQAGVMPALRATGLADLVYHNDWALNPAEALKKTIVAHFIAQQRVNADYQADFSLPLPEFLQLHALLGTGTLVVLLDQFEEFFYYQRFSQQRDEFIRQLAGAIQDTDTPTAFVFSMREDFAMEMEAFKPWFAGIFSNIYRIEKLGLDAARQAIEGPVQAVGFTYQADLLDKLLTDLGQRERNGRLDLQPIDGQDLTQPLVEPPHLQIVCQQLWLAASASKERKINIQHYQQLGAADGILNHYFDDKIARLSDKQRRLASRAFDLLVSQHGAKMSYPLDELAKLLNQDKAALQETLEELQNAAILRRVLRQGYSWYELYHDIFAKHIVAWNQAYKRKQLLRQLLIRGGLLVLAGVAMWVAYDGGMNYQSRHLRLGKKTVPERVELYQGQWGSQNIFHQHKFVYESDYERSDIEADKRFETAAIAEREQTAVMQIGQLPLAQRYTAYAELGLFTNADKVFDAIRKAEDKNLISDVAIQLQAARVKNTISYLQILIEDRDTDVHKAAIDTLFGLNSQAAIKLPLLTLLKDDDYDVRQMAIKALSDLKAQEAIQPLLALLKDNHTSVREAAIRALSDLKAQEAIQPLLTLLKDDDASVRSTATGALSDLNPQAAYPHLLVMIKDDDASVRSAAIGALSGLKVQAAIQPFLALLRDDIPFVREAAIKALSDLNAQAAIQPLMALLNDDIPFVREAAIKALSDLKAQEAIPPLLALLKDNHTSVREAAIKALSDLKAQEAIQPLIDLLKDDDADVRQAAIKALFGLNAQTAIQPLLALLKDHDQYVRQEAIKALIGLNAQTAIQPLLALLKDDDTDVRQAAVDVLSGLKGHTAIQPMLALLKDNDAHVRQAVIKALANLNAQAAIQSLLALLKNDIPFVREAAIKALSGLKAQTANQPLLALLQDNDDFVRRATIKALSELNAQAAIQPLLDLLQDDDDFVRSWTIEALSDLNAQAAVQPLLALLKDNGIRVRQAAIEALAKLNAQAAILHLIALLEDVDADVRQAAIKALSALNAQAAVQPLLALLNYDDADVRQSSIKALSDLNAQTAIQPLLALVKGNDNYVSQAATNALKQMKVLMMDSDGEIPTPANKLIIKLKDDDLSKQQSAALALSKLPQPPYELTEWQTEQITRLDSALNDGTVEKLRIAYDLGFVPVAKTVELLASLLQEQDVNVVKTVVMSLGKIAETKAAWIQPYVQQFLAFSENQDLDLQLAAIKALGQVYGGQPNLAVQQQLLKIATDSSSHEHLRLAAVDALGGTGRPEIAALLFGLLQDKNQATLHFAIVYWLAKMPELADKKAVLSVLQQRLAGLEQDKANWRGLRDAYKTGQSEHEKPIVCYDPAQDNSGLTRWCDDYKIYQYAYAIAMQDPENAGITLLNHPSYQTRAAAIRALVEKASGELLQKLLAYYQNFDWQDLPSPRPYTTYRAIDKVLAQLENGSEHDLKILQGLKTQLDIPAKSENPTDQEQQQAALIERFDWTIDELKYRVQQKITTLQPTNAP